jgi:predicted transcriptional regulator
MAKGEQMSNDARQELIARLNKAIVSPDKMTIREIAALFLSCRSALSECTGVVAVAAPAVDYRKALEELVAAVDRVLPKLNGIFATNFARTGHQYDGPTFGKELDAARALLAAQAPKDATPGEGK